MAGWRTKQIELMHWRREKEFIDICADLTENTVLRRYQKNGAHPHTSIANHNSHAKEKPRVSEAMCVRLSQCSLIDGLWSMITFCWTDVFLCRHIEHLNSYLRGARDDRRKLEQENAALHLKLQVSTVGFWNAMRKC